MQVPAGPASLPSDRLLQLPVSAWGDRQLC